MEEQEIIAAADTVTEKKVRKPYVKKRKMLRVGETLEKKVYKEASVYGRKRGVNKKGTTRKTLADGLPKHAKALIKKKKITLSVQSQRRRGKKPRYQKGSHIKIHDDCDLLENFMMVRAYIQHKYKLSLSDIEMLLYLFPKRLFTYQDYLEMPKSTSFKTLKNMLADGYMRKIGKGPRNEVLYTYTPLVARIVRSFYECLSGEQPVPADGIRMMSMRNASPIDKMKASLIKKINAQGPSENKKKYYM